jgi:hypothetical protein
MSIFPVSASVLIIIIGIAVAGVCLAGARMKGGSASFNRTVFYTIAALLVALLIWLVAMVLFVGPAMK